MSDGGYAARRRDFAREAEVGHRIGWAVHA